MAPQIQVALESAESVDSGQVGENGPDAKKSDKISSLSGTIALLKMIIGAGSFALPAAFSEGGLLGAIIVAIGMGAIGAWTAELISRIERFVRLRDGVKHPYSYAELAGAVWPAPLCWFNRRKWSCGGSWSGWVDEFEGDEVEGDLMVFNLGETLVTAAIVIISVGVCGVYVLFISQVMIHIVGTKYSAWVLIVLSAMVVLLAQLRSFHLLAFTSTLGTIAVTAAIIATIVAAALPGGKDLTMGEGGEVHPKAWSWVEGGIVTTATSIAFLFAVHSNILPLLQSVRKGESRLVVTCSAWLLAAVINTIFAVIVTLMIATDIQSNVLLNLKNTGLLIAIKVILCVDLLFTIPIVAAAAREVCERNVLAFAGIEDPALDKKDLEEHVQDDEEDFFRQSIQNLSISDLDDQENMPPDVRESPRVVLGIRPPPSSPLKKPHLASSHSEHLLNPASALTKNPILAEIIKTVVRLILAGLTIGVPYAIPSFADLVNYLGGGSIIFAFILPPLLALKVDPDGNLLQRQTLSPTSRLLRKIGFISLALLGAAISIYGTYHTATNS